MAHNQGGPASPKLMGPERASISMLKRGSSSQFELRSLESAACEGSAGSGSSGAGLGGSSKGSPLVVGSPKSSMFHHVTERLNEMSCRARPPTPVGTVGDVGATLGHLAPPRRAHSRFASPSRADGLQSRMTSHSGTFTVSSPPSQLGGPSHHTRPASPMPHDLEPSERSVTGRVRIAGGSPLRSSSCFATDAGSPSPAQLPSGSPPSSLQGSHNLSTIAYSGTQKSAPLSWFHHHSDATGPAYSPKPNSRCGPHLGLGDKTSAVSRSGPLQPFLAAIAQQGIYDHNLPTLTSRKSHGSISDDSEAILPRRSLELATCAGSPKGGSFTQGSRRNSVAGKHLPTIPDEDALRVMTPQPALEPMRQPAVNGNYPSYSAVGARGPRPPGKEPDSLSSWMLTRPG